MGHYGLFLRQFCVAVDFFLSLWVVVDRCRFFWRVKSSFVSGFFSKYESMAKPLF